jgi:hypothetical protein
MEKEIMNITKEEFLKYMKSIEVFLQESEDSNKAIKLLCDDSFYVKKGDLLLDSYIELLKKLTNDENNWIEYFVFECRFGKNENKVTINNKTFRLNSVEKLWGILIGE